MTTSLTVPNATEPKDRRKLLSTLWIFLTANYIYCDVFTLMNANDLKQILTGTVGSIQMTQEFLLTFAIVMELPLAMIVLSKVLPFAVNRWVNIGAALSMAAIQVWSIFGSGASAPTLHYIFFSIVEITCTVFIVCYCWGWKKAGSTGAV